MTKELVYCKHGGEETKSIYFNVPFGDNQELLFCRQCYLTLIGGVNQAQQKLFSEETLKRYPNYFGVAFTEEQKEMIAEFTRKLQKQDSENS